MGWQEGLVMVRLGISTLTAEASYLSAECSWQGKDRFLRHFLEEQGSQSWSMLSCIFFFFCKPVESVTLSSKDIPRRRGY